MKKINFLLARMDGQRIASAKIVKAKNNNEVVIPRGYQLICNFMKKDATLLMLKSHGAVLER